jgi:hypothetical protein
MGLVFRCTLYRETETTLIFPYTCKSVIAPIGPIDHGIKLVGVVSMGCVLSEASVSRDEDSRSQNARMSPMATVALKQHGCDLFSS